MGNKNTGGDKAWNPKWKFVPPEAKPTMCQKVGNRMCHWDTSAGPWNVRVLAMGAIGTFIGLATLDQLHRFNKNAASIIQPPAVHQGDTERSGKDGRK